MYNRTFWGKTVIFALLLWATIFFSCRMNWSIAFLFVLQTYNWNNIVLEALHFIELLKSNPELWTDIVIMRLQGVEQMTSKLWIF